MSTSNETEEKDTKEKKEKNSSSIVTKESLGAVCALFSALALLMLITGDLIFGKVGTGVTEVLLGTFGYFAYPVFIGFFYLSFTSFFGLKLVKNRKAATFLALTVFFIGLIVHTATTAFRWETSEYLGNCFVAGGSFGTATVCGIIGGLFVWALSALLHPVGAIVVLSFLTVICGYVFVRIVSKKKILKKEWLISPFRKKEKAEEEAAVATAQAEPAYETAQSPYAQPLTGGYQTPYTAPDTRLQGGQEGWNASNSYSPFVPSGGYTREESRAVLFGSSPAEDYTKNLLFDKNSRVNNRPIGQPPTYTQTYENSFSEPVVPEKIVTDYTRPTPSYTHPAFDGRQEGGLLRSTDAFVAEEKPVDVEPRTVREEPVAPLFSDRGRGENLGLDSDRRLREENSLDDFSRESREDFSRAAESPLRSDRTENNFRDLFSEKPAEPFERSRIEERSDRFVSPFDDRELTEESDFMPREESSDFISRDTFTTREPSSDRLSDRVNERLTEERTTRFSEIRETPVSPILSPKEEEVAPPPVEKPKYIRPYSAPPLNYFDCMEVRPDCSPEEVEGNKKMILATLDGFGIKDAVISSVTHGPTVTRYNVVTPINVSSKKIIGLADQFAVNLHAEHGVNVSFNYVDGATSIEVPNINRQFVNLGCMLTGAGYVTAKPNTLTFTLGIGVSNDKIYGDIAKMTHILVAGASGMGKSAFLRSLIISLIVKYSPQDLRLILIDPKMADFTLYTGIPHLVINEIICKPQQAVQSLRWAIGEMERRYELFRRKSLAGTYVVNVDGYNENLQPGEEKLAKIVIIVDELADLMSVAKKDVEDCIQRLTAKARAAGIHMILATQRPSVDVVTGVIKSNLPTRIACAVSSEIDSRVILDVGGAEKLLAKGDMLYSMAGFKNPVRVQAPYIDDKPAQNVINFIRENNDCDFNTDAMSFINASGAPTGSVSSGLCEVEPVYIDALKVVIQHGTASISMIQRKCSVGFNKAGKIIEWMEEMHYIAEFDGSPKPRKVLITQEEFEEKYGEF